MKHRTHSWYRAALVGSMLLVVLAGFALVLLLPRITHATASTSQHQHPNRGIAGVSYSCGPDTGYSCTAASGYKGANATGWAKADYGCPYASGCAAGIPHNCTLYAAYRLMQNGVADPRWSANAYGWARAANLHGVPVNQTPAVGAIAQWNLTVGHVAYVEASDSSGITITMDDYYTSSPWPNGYTAKVHIAVGSPAWPDNFLHFKDKSTSNQPAFYAGKIVQWNGDTKPQKTAWLVSPDLKRYWIPSSSIYYCLTGHGFPFAGAISSTLLNQMPDQTGKWATCGGDSLKTNQFLFRGSYLRSGNGLYFLQLQRSDGNLVLYGPSGALWANSKSSDFLIMQGDHNLVTYGFGTGATWATGTNPTGATTLVVQNDGNLVLYAPGGVPVWDRYHGRLR